MGDIVLVDIAIKRNGKYRWYSLFAKLIGDSCVFTFKGRTILATA
jgi:hypothetical protein